LAARLTGCRIDIKSESKVAETEQQVFSSFDGSQAESEEVVEDTGSVETTSEMSEAAIDTPAEKQAA